MAILNAYHPASWLDVRLAGWMDVQLDGCIAGCTAVLLYGQVMATIGLLCALEGMRQSN